MVQRVRDLYILLVLLFLAVIFTNTAVAKATRAEAAAHSTRHGRTRGHSKVPSAVDDTASFCLSWRLAVETDNVKEWRTTPIQCWLHIQDYIVGGQYCKDLNFIMQPISEYVDQIVVSGDGFDAWILDVDDTCLSNVLYYRRRRFGCDPYDPEGFRSWASKGENPAIPAVLNLFKKLVKSGFHVFLISGRDEDMLGQATTFNLHNQGFLGYHRLIMRSEAQRGKSAIIYKSEVRKQLIEEGYRIWGNVGDQWSDLQGYYPGNMTFKLPNPMYFVP